MNKDLLIQFLQTGGIASHAIAVEIAEKFQHKTIIKNQPQLVEGKVCDEYLFLEQGFMRAFAHDTEGAEVTTNLFSPGQMVFEVSSFFNRTRSKENIVALTDCAGWYITFAELNGLFHSLPQFREFGRSVLVKGFAEFKNRALSMITETAEERYATLLKTNPEIFQHAALKHIASYLGVTDTSLSRIRKEFSKK
ncbi:Crp/Fnr family transcriptional regulator [Mucilaginibacter pedocola]|uniref:Crp/Fnr family transcriptional regulator n=1 Tax=Mucilaginibacter pedocola TaxID=1792845 RepID=A0A1S9PHR7_9SPHI|nr:Crp/Fnr family transcriptional regulator [Mucilaginibacter pedocola]OOQ60502.1 Crp/Fnr family transcriptional regulator [Mucilaginibacter pedocola]